MERWRLYTSNYIVAEAHSLVLNRLGRRLAARFLAEIDRSPTTVVRVAEEDERRARDILDRYADKDFSLTDATSFAIMERLGIAFAFTFDSDFAAYDRFTILQP
jgi:predicted nucleic acid-binding protein